MLSMRAYVFKLNFKKESSRISRLMKQSYVVILLSFQVYERYALSMVTYGLRYRHFTYKLDCGYLTNSFQ